MNEWAKTSRFFIENGKTQPVNCYINLNLLLRLLYIKIVIIIEGQMFHC